VPNNNKKKEENMKQEQRAKWSERYKINPKETVDKAVSYSIIKQAKKYVDLAIEEIDSNIELGHTDKHEDRDCKTNLIQSLNCQSRELKQALERLQ